MLGMVGRALLFLSLFSIIAPPSFLGTNGRRKAILSALFASGLLIAVDPGSPTKHEVAVAPTPEQAADKDRRSSKEASAAAPIAPIPQEVAATASPPASIEAIRAGDSLFVDIRRQDNIYCALDAPPLVVAEIDGQFLALNGTARSWVPNLSMYKEGKWMKVLDPRKDPRAGLRPEQVGQLISIGTSLCPSSKANLIEDMRERESRKESSGSSDWVRNSDWAM